MHFENEIEHKILVTYVIAKVSTRQPSGDLFVEERAEIDGVDLCRAEKQAGQQAFLINDDFVFFHRIPFNIRDHLFRRPLKLLMM